MKYTDFTGFSISPGVLGLMGRAGSKKKSEEYTFYLKGSLSQMSEQEAHLRRIGVEATHSDVYPVIKEADVERSLRSIYICKVDGWWHYQEKYIALGICTQQEFESALHEQARADKVREEEG